MTHTEKPHPADLHDEFELPPPDRLQAHYRRQLSAMLDGELSTDEGKFMQRRLEHDAALAACRERWQLCGDVLRGQPVPLLAPDFADRVAAALRELPQVDGVADAGTAARVRAPRWAGRLALAASVAVVALFVGRQMPGRDDASAGMQAGNTVVEGSSTVPAPGLAVVDPARSAPVEITLGDAGDAGASAATVAVASLPLAAAGTRSRGQSQRAARRVRVASSARAVARAGALPAPAAADGAGVATADPFLASSIAPARPWPRAVLPAAGSAGRFMAGYPAAASDWSFPGFEPLPQAVGIEIADDTGEPTEAASGAVGKAD
ncbi:MAG TPA: sigma-E factor negative regulatory protein [Luteimonas sp.]|nr:sigma-E factor negative regulatory protein [Luteimonas sp.]